MESTARWLISAILALLGLSLGLAAGTLPRAGRQATRPWILALASLGAWLLAYVLIVWPAPPGGPRVPVLERTEQVMIALALLVLAAMAVPAAWRSRRRLPVSQLALWSLAFVLPLSIRLVFPRILLHSEQFGTRLVADMMAFPDPAYFRWTYGQVSFFVLGALARLAGTWQAIFVVNAVAAAATVTVLAVLLHRWTRSPVVVVAFVLLASFHPILVRVAASEDAQNLGQLAFFAGLLALDRYLDDARRSRSAIAASLLFMLAVLSRQTSMLLLPMAALLVLERGGIRRLVDRDIVAGLAMPVMAWLPHVLRGTAAQRYAALGMTILLPRVPALLLAEPHPIIDFRINSWLLPILWVVGLAAVRPPVRWTLRLSFLVTLAGTALWCRGGPGMEFLFRMSVLWISTVLGAIGAGAVLSRLQSSGWAWAAAAVALLAVVHTASSISGLMRTARVDPLTQEMTFLANALPRLPAGTVIVAPSVADDFQHQFPTEEEPKPNWIFPPFITRDPSITVLSVRQWKEKGAPEAGCTLFYRSLLCYSLGMGECWDRFRASSTGLHTLANRSLAGSDAIDAKRAMAIINEEIDAEVELSRNDDCDPGRLLSARTVCFDTPRVADRPFAGLAATLTVPERPYVPNLAYPRDEMTVGFYPIGTGDDCR